MDSFCRLQFIRERDHRFFSFKKDLPIRRYNKDKYINIYHIKTKYHVCYVIVTYM